METLSKETYFKKKIKRYVGLGVFFISFIVYILTVAPTTSYWDCGEFITTSHILGIPHPPGAPFYLMLGRFFSMIPFVGDIGLRVNMISVLSSSFTVLFLFLTSVRLIEIWRGKVKSTSEALVVYGSSVIGALTFAFTYTFWFNAVEAEVYALSMFFTSSIVWLLMVWIEHHKVVVEKRKGVLEEVSNPEATRYILLIMLLVGLGTGVHLLNILTLPTVIFIMFFYDRKMAIISFFGMTLSVIVLFGSPIDWKFYELIGFFAIIIVLLNNAKYKEYSLAFIMPLLLIIGYSTYVMIYIRAGLNPPINENDPSTIENLIAYLNREQYGDEAQMRNAVYLLFGEENRKYLESIAKMGLNPGSAEDPWKSHWSFFWNYQIVDMYVRYFNWQFVGRSLENIKQVTSINGLFAIPFLAGLWGALHHFFKDWKRASGFLMLFIVMSLGLVIYQNQDWGQPRERDYFYVGSFFVFSIWIGMGITSILEAIKDNFKSKFLLIPILIIALVIPTLELNANYHVSDRTGNYLAWDYSKNILESCDQNAVLFTNGDNDTFPLWYLQEVEGIRKDVVIINLSLANTDWYISQIQEKIPELLNYSEKQLKDYFSQRHMTEEAFYKRVWNEPRTMRIPAKNGLDYVEWVMNPTVSVNTKEGPVGLIKVQDEIVYEVIKNNAYNGWKRPVSFAVTVSKKNYIGITDYMRMDGLVYTVVDYKAKRDIDPKVLYDRLFVRYKGHFRGLDDPDVYFDDNKIRLMQNYRSAFIQLASHYLDPSENLSSNSQSMTNFQEGNEFFEKELTFEEFEKLEDNKKVAYVLYRMENVVPSNTIPFTTQMIIPELAGLLYKSGQTQKGLVILQNADLSKLSSEDLIEFLVKTYRFGYKDYALTLIDEVISRGDDLDVVSKIRYFTELFIVLDHMGATEDKDKLQSMIISEIDGIENNKVKQVVLKDYAVGVYTTGDIPEALGILNSIYEANPSDIEALDYSFQILYRENRYLEALGVINKILEVKPDYRDYPKKKEALEKLIELSNEMGEEQKEN